VINRYVGNLPPMRGVFPGHLAPVIRNGAYSTDCGAVSAMACAVQVCGLREACGCAKLQTT
jgi:hypothetical protein